MPDILTRQKWDCSEAAELSKWAVEFLQRESEFSSREDDIGTPLSKLFRSMTDIRNVAVHRNCVSARALEQFLLNAESLTTLLGDTTRLESLAGLRRNVQQAIEELERNKHLLDSQLKETLRKIAAQRTELDRAEEMAISEMMKKDGEYQAFAGKNLEEAVVSSAASAAVATEKEEKTSSTSEPRTVRRIIVDLFS